MLIKSDILYFLSAAEVFLKRQKGVVCLRKFSIILLFFLVQNIYAQEIEFSCKQKNVECAKESLDLILKDKDYAQLDKFINTWSPFHEGNPQITNLLGVALLHKSDPASIVESEQLLLESLGLGVKAAAQNLAELYFLLE